MEKGEEGEVEVFSRRNRSGKVEREEREEGEATYLILL